MSARNKPKGPFSVRLCSHLGYTFEGEVTLLTGARQHARSLLRRPHLSSRTYALIENRYGYSETMTLAEARR